MGDLLYCASKTLIRLVSAFARQPATDVRQSREVPGAAGDIYNDLLWAGVVPDEGGRSPNSPYGPYVQSQRLQLYREHIETLLKVRYRNRSCLLPPVNSSSQFVCLFFAPSRRLEMPTGASATLIVWRR